jgi:hypothetical protein
METLNDTEMPLKFVKFKLIISKKTKLVPDELSHTFFYYKLLFIIDLKVQNLKESKLFIHCYDA